MKTPLGNNPAIRWFALAALVAAAAAAGAPPTVPANARWQTVANNADFLPGTAKTFNSYNPPSVNNDGLVVFRARSKGPQPMSGIYTRHMGRRAAAVIELLADRDSVVPDPNNTLYGPGARLATFNEFPSFPRIALHTPTVATRGNHQPVWTYSVVDETTGEVTESRVGTTGVYVTQSGHLVTGTSLLGAVGSFGYFSVPGSNPAAKFDVFPGAPAVTDEGVIVFKANFVRDGAGRTGVFYRPIAASGVAPVERLADSGTLIPNLPAGVTGVTFGSTAPPSAADGQAVFVGYDNEQAPSYGGIYIAPLSPDPPLATLVGLGETVPVPGATETFNRIGEALTFDGRLVGFWAAWGDDTRTVRLYCPEDGNADRIAFCTHDGVAGDPASIQDPATGKWYQDKTVPVHQGIFVHDTVTGRTTMLAQTGDGYDDFVYWNYSGSPPGVGHGEADAEPPRWRSSAFLALSGKPLALRRHTVWTYKLAFLARTGQIGPEFTWINAMDGIYLASGPGQGPVKQLLATGMDGTRVDPAAVDAYGSALPVTSIGIERDGFRGARLAVSVGMGNEESGWAGVYIATLPGLGPD